MASPDDVKRPKKPTKVLKPETVAEEKALLERQKLGLRRLENITDPNMVTVQSMRMEQAGGVTNVPLNIYGYADPNNRYIEAYNPGIREQIGITDRQVNRRLGLNEDGSQTIAGAALRERLPKGTLVSTDGIWYASLSPMEQSAIRLHNEGVAALVVSNGGDINTAPMVRPLYDAPGIPIDEMPFVVVTDAQRARYGVSIDGKNTKDAQPDPGPLTAKPMVGTRDAPVAIDAIPMMSPIGTRVDGSTMMVNNAGPSTTARGTVPGTPTGASGGAAIDPATGLIAPQPAVATGLTGDPAASGNWPGGAAASTIMSNPQTALQYLLNREGNGGPANVAMYRQQMNAMPALFLTEFADQLSVDADGVIDPNNPDASLFDQAMTGGLIDDAQAFEYAQSFLDAQRGAGIDPNLAMQKFLTGARSVPGGTTINPLQIMANSGTAQSQVEFAKGQMQAALVNANPYMVDPIMTVVDYLGNQYLAAGGDGNGFVNWLLQQPMFQRMTGGM